jgi:hypothetical protein
MLCRAGKNKNRLAQKQMVERETGIEPATNGLGSRYSTIELLPPDFLSVPNGEAGYLQISGASAEHAAILKDR